MVKFKKGISLQFFTAGSGFEKPPEVRTQNLMDQILFHVLDTSRSKIYGINLTKNCPFQPFHPEFKPDFELLDYILSENIEAKAMKETQAIEAKQTSILIGQTFEPFAPCEKIKRSAISLGKQLIEKGFKIWFQTRAVLDLELFENLLYMEEKVQLLLPFNTLSDRIAKSIEPFSPSPSNRLKQLDTLKNLGIPFEVSIDSLIPGLNDSKSNLFPLLESLANKGIKRTTISYIHLKTKDLLFSTKQNSKITRWFEGNDYNLNGSEKIRLVTPGYRKSKYAEIISWGKQLGMDIMVDGYANPDMARNSITPNQNNYVNLKERYLALSSS